MKGLDELITRLANHILRVEAQQAKKPLEYRIRYLNKLSCAHADLLKFSEEYRILLYCI